MAIKAPKSESQHDPVPAGNHVARCYRVLHIGTVPDVINGEQKIVNKVRIGFELPNETKVFKEGEAAQPYVIDREFTLSMFERSNLYKLVVGVIGKQLTEEEAEALDITDLLGKECMLNVVHAVSEKNGKTYANIASAAPIPKGVTVPPAVNASQVLDFDNWNQELFESLPDFIRDKITASDEFKALKGPAPAAGAAPSSDEIHF